VDGRISSTATFLLNKGNAVASTRHELDLVCRNQKDHLIFVNDKSNFPNKAGIKNAPVMSAIVSARMSGISDELLLGFMRVLSTGISDSEQDGMIIRLRDSLIDIGVSGVTEKTQAYRKTQRVIKALYLNEKLSRIPNPTDDVFLITKERLLSP
jgi:hypothetical protein